MGSVSLRKSEDVNLRKWFDYFSLDFNEELSGLVGSLLEKQTQFAISVIDHVLSFYDKGREIILVGHSMGGIVARAILSRGYGDRIYLIYTQATPHLAPPMFIDKEIIAFYRDLKTAEASMNKFDTPIVSVSGGRRGKSRKKRSTHIFILSNRRFLTHAGSRGIGWPNLYDFWHVPSTVFGLRATVAQNV